LHIVRYDLIATLARPTPGVTVRTAAEVSSYQQDRDAVTVTLGDGEELTAEVFIGADGIHSAVRTQMLGPEAPRFTGNVAWRVLVPIDRLGDLAPPPTACVWVGDKRHAVTYRVRSGTYANLVAVVEHTKWAEESWTQRGTREDALADFRGWHPTITTLIDRADAHYRWALFDRAPLPRWSDGRVALLGDACHPMLPFQAQGASMAIEDGWVLAEQLDRHDDPAQALADYTQRRLPRTSKVQAESRANATRFHHGSTLHYRPLQLAAKLRPHMLTERFDWLYQADVTR
jgi:salicylate hydroxylase